MEPANYLKAIHSWEVNDFEVRLLENNNSLEYETADKTNFKTISKGLFDLGEYTKEQMVSGLKECRVMIGTGGQASFFKPFKTWKLENYEAHLVEGTDDLIWDIFCNSTKSSSLHSLKDSTIPSARCHPETVAIIEKIKNECFKDQRQIIDLVNDFKVVQITDSDKLKEERKKINNDIEFEKRDLFIKKTQNVCLASFASGTIISVLGPSFGYGTITLVAGALGKPALVLGGIAATTFTSTLVLLPLCPIICAAKYYWVKNQCELSASKIDLLMPQKTLLVEIEPRITAPSLIDKRVLVSKFTWAVTLVTHGGSLGNHAEVYIEGVNDGFYTEKSSLIREAKPIAAGEKFLHLAHFQPQIESGLFSPDELEFETRSEVWMVTSDKVKTMLRNIEIEKKLPRDQRVNFNLAGMNALGHKIYGENGHNCFTWSKKHLKTIGIDLKEKRMPPSLSGYVVEAVTDYTKAPNKYIETPLQWI